MCFYKGRRKAKIATKDIFVTKTCESTDIADMTFTSAIRDFVYKQGVTYKKFIWHRLRAHFQDNLESEVFHCYGIGNSKDNVIPYNNGKYSQCTGVFMIPKGTKYYDGDNGCFATFAIKYVGRLNEERSKLVLNQ